MASKIVTKIVIKQWYKIVTRQEGDLCDILLSLFTLSFKFNKMWGFNTFKAFEILFLCLICGLFIIC